MKMTYVDKTEGTQAGAMPPVPHREGVWLVGWFDQ